MELAAHTSNMTAGFKGEGEKRRKGEGRPRLMALEPSVWLLKMFHTWEGSVNEANYEGGVIRQRGKVGGKHGCWHKYGKGFRYGPLLSWWGNRGKGESHNKAL